MSSLRVDLDFLENFWKQGLKSDHAFASDVFKEWANAGHFSKVVEAGRVPYQGGGWDLQPLEAKEYNQAVDAIVLELQKNLTKSGPHRKEAWEKGWKESFEDFGLTRAEESLIPGYFESSRIVRLGTKLYKVPSGEVEAGLLALLVDLTVAVVHQIYGFENIHEFGCGTGIHARRLARSYPSALVTGYDWASFSQEILMAIRVSESLVNLQAKNFDFFAPDVSVQIESQDLVLTVAALEQTGSEFRSFLETLISKRPGVIINIEPMAELLDTSSQLGQFSAKYFRKRQYLDGYFQALVEKNDDGQIEILNSGRSGIGSLFIEGYSVVVWRPLR